MYVENPVRIACWLPLAILWFGLSESAIIFVVVMGSLLAIAISTEDGVRGIDPLLLRASGVLGIHGLRFYGGVLLPAALPGIQAAVIAAAEDCPGECIFIDTEP